MAILRKSALALAAMFCLGVAVPVLAQDGTAKATADVKSAQSTLKDMKALGAEIRARQGGAAITTTPVAAPVVRRRAANSTATDATPKKAKKPAKKKKTP